MGVNARFDGYTSPARLLRFARAIAAVLTASRYRVPRNDCKSAQKRLQTYSSHWPRVRSRSSRPTDQAPAVIARMCTSAGTKVVARNCS